jgi:hypothetical protein
MARIIFVRSCDEIDYPHEHVVNYEGQFICLEKVEWDEE